MRTIFLICFPLLLMAQDPDDLARQQQANSPAVVAGKAAFQQTCGFCHGRDARGASGPDLLRSSIVSHDVDGNLIGQVVHNGRPEKGMPAFQLPDSEIKEIAAFLHEQASVAASVAREIPSHATSKEIMRRSRTTRHAPLVNEAWFSFFATVPDEFTHR